MRDWVAFVRERLDLPPMHGHRDERFVRELADHLEDLHREALQRGRSVDEAEALVEAELRDRAAVRSELFAVEPRRVRARAERWAESREARLRSRGSAGSFVADRMQALRRVLRSLSRQPVFALTTIAVLAVGIGANSAIFALVHAVVLEPLPFPESDRLVTIAHSAPSLGIDYAGQSAAWHFTYEEHARTLASVTLYYEGNAAVVGVGDPEARPVLYTTRSMLSTLRLDPVIGRSFSDAEMDPTASATAMLGEDYWVAAFGADPAVIGQTIQVDGTRRTIVGVAPAGVEALGMEVDLVLPLRYQLSRLIAGNNIGLEAVARLADDASIDEARADLARVLPRAWELYPRPLGGTDEQVRAYAPVIDPLKERLVGDTAPLLWTLFGGVLILLLMSCANVAGLVLVRADGRSTEMAVRTAMGAGRGRVRWEFTRETIVLGLLGSALGLAIAGTILRVLVAMAPAEIPRLAGIAIGPVVVGYSALIAVGAGIVFGLISTRLNGRQGLSITLRGAGRGSLSRGRGALGLGALASAQVALAVALMVGAGLLVRTLDSLASVDAGFAADGDYEVLRVTIPQAEVEDVGAAADLLARVAARLEEVPGVTGVAMASAIPLAGGMNVNPFIADGVPTAADASVMNRHKWVGGGYFEVLGIDVVAGRELTWDDVRLRAPVAVLSEALAIRHWGSAEAALGARVAARSDAVRWHEVVGVVEDVRGDGLSFDAPELVYWPQVTLGFWQGTTLDLVHSWRTMAFAVEGIRSGDEAFRRDLKEAVWDVVPTVPVRSVGTMGELRGRSMARTSFAATLLGTAALMALLIGVVGVYGVMGYATRMRMREFGLRIALGASAADVSRLVLRRGMAIVGIGVTAGVGIALAGGTLLRGLLFQVEAWDPLTLTVTPLLLAATVLTAAMIPARRAGRSDPTRALRSE